MLGNKRLEGLVSNNFASFLYELPLPLQYEQISHLWTSQDIGLLALIRVLDTFLFALPNA